MSRINNKEGNQSKSFKRSYADKIFDGFNLGIMIILLFVFAWPLWFVVIASFSDPSALWRGEVILWPVGFTTRAYKAVIEYAPLWRGYLNTIIYTGIGTILNVILNICAAYPLSSKEFMGKKFVLVFLMITMYFNGGIIPTYILTLKLGLIDTPLVMIIAGAVSVFNIFVMRTYFQHSIPEALWEAARLDGADAYQYLVKVVSKPIIAVIALYYGVGHWNDYFTALVYIKNHDLLPLQNIMKELLFTVANNDLNPMGTGMTMEQMQARRELAALMKYSTIICATVPVLCVYPFVQKFFVKGVMIGSVKG